MKLWKWLLIGGLGVGTAVVLSRRASSSELDRRQQLEPSDSDYVPPSNYCTADNKPAPKAGGSWQCREGNWKFRKDRNGRPTLVTTSTPAPTATATRMTLTGMI